MKYSTISFERTINPKSPWRVAHTTDNFDRVPCKVYKPDGALGFFHYPKKWPIEKAFNMLKDAMIERRQQEIKSWEREINRIQQVKLEDFIKNE